MNDYKYTAQLRAEEIAEDEFGCDFYSLTSEQQIEVYQRGLDQYFGSLETAADSYRPEE